MAAIRDEARRIILDEGGQPIYDEAGVVEPKGPVFPPPEKPWLSLAVGPRSGAAPTQPVTAFSNLRIVDSLTSGPSCTFTMPGDSPAALVTDGLATDLWVYQIATSTSLPKWMRLNIQPIEQEWGESGEDDVSVAAVGYRQVLEARHIVSGPPVFTGVEQGDIIWQLVQHTQAQPGGNLGISAGDLFTGQPRDRTQYKIGDQLGHLIDDLSNVINGVWWGIDADKILNVQLWDTFPQVGPPIVHGMNATKLRRSPAPFANAAGAAGADTVTFPVWRTAPGIDSDVRGRWEVYDASHSDVIDQDVVAEYADGLLAEFGHPPNVWSAALVPAAYFTGDSRYHVGDIVPIIIPSSAVNEVGVSEHGRVDAQVTEISIGFDDSGAATVDVTAVEVTVG